MGERFPIDPGELTGTSSLERPLTKAELKAAREKEKKRKADQFRQDRFKQSPHQQKSNLKDGDNTSIRSMNRIRRGH